MLTEKDYCDNDTCVALKELGYPILWFEDETYHENSTEISLYEAQKWLREVKQMILQPTYLELSDEWICVIRDKKRRHGYSAQKQKDYEEALLEGVKSAIKILKEE